MFLHVSSWQVAWLNSPVSQFVRFWDYFTAGQGIPVGDSLPLGPRSVPFKLHNRILTHTHTDAALSSALMVRQLLDQSCPPAFLAQGILAQCPSAELVIFDQTKWPAGCLRGFVKLPLRLSVGTLHFTRRLLILISSRCTVKVWIQTQTHPQTQELSKCFTLLSNCFLPFLCYQVFFLKNRAYA